VSASGCALLPPLVALRDYSVWLSFGSEESVDLGVRHQARKPGEAALRHQGLSGAHEAGPRRQCQRAADADASHAKRCNLVHAQTNVPDHEHIERFRGNR